MSNRRLNKNVQRGQLSNEKFSYVPVFVSDSKGRYLKAVSQDSNIVWVYKGGANSSNAFTWIHKNLRKWFRKYKCISLYVFIGTCDFTVKERRYIYLHHDQDGVLQRIRNNLKGIYEICSSVCANVKLTLLQIPYYSIERWNAGKGHPQPEQFKQDDIFLTQQIDSINEFIDRLNQSIGTYSPKFNEDLRRSRKRPGKKPRYSWNFGLYQDGVHPCTNLSKSWFASIYRKMLRDCL